MNKFLKKLIVGLIGATLFFTSTVSAFATFTDVSNFNRYFEAISYLQENGIINGYNDGTFRPFQTVNRAEFLKIIIEGSGIITDITTAVPFSDIPNNVWYTPYVKKAYNEGWINGYGDGTFKPEQTISKVEALKILGKAQNWQIPNTVTQQLFSDTDNTAWYIGYVKYAKDHNYLEETGSLFLPLSQMTRGQISEILFRSLTLTSSDTTIDEVISSDTTPDTTSQNYTFFDNIALSESLPETFLKNEIYVIEGHLTNSSNDSEINAIIENVQTQKRKIFSESVTNNQFSLPITFSDAGTYKIGIFPNSANNSKAVQVTVSGAAISTTETQALPSPPTNISISFQDDHTKLNFNSNTTNTLKKITFTQNNISKTFFSRQDLSNIPLPYSSFSNFNEGSMNAYIEIAKKSENSIFSTSSQFTKSEILNFTAAEHTFDMIDSSVISTNAPDTISNLSTISFSGSIQTDIQHKAYLIKSNGLTETLALTSSGATGDYFGSTTIKSGSNFTFSYTPTSVGRYIVAIDNKLGEPIFSHPIYIGNSTPLIPDFFDLNERELFSGTLNLQNSQAELLNLINTARQNHGLASLALSPELNTLAQSHSDDMAQNNYFAHVDQANNTPDDRRLSAGITTPVGENIARDTSIEFNHYSLMRSPSHRVNILKSDWQRVGFGITAKDGYIYLTEEFSTNPLTASDLSNFKTELLESINTKRSNNGNTALTYSIALENASIYLNDKSKNDPSSFTQQLFEESLNNNNIQGSSAVTNVTSGNWSDSLNSIINEETSIFDPLWELIGIDIDTDNEGVLHTIIIINK